MSSVSELIIKLRELKFRPPLLGNWERWTDETKVKMNDSLLLARQTTGLVRWQYIVVTVGPKLRLEGGGRIWVPGEFDFFARLIT